MSVVQEIIVICNACPSLEESGRQRHPSKTVIYTSSEADALAEARNRGWRRDTHGNDVCPDHPELECPEPRPEETRCPKGLKCTNPACVRKHVTSLLTGPGALNG